jgi:hypothetical protein
MFVHTPILGGELICPPRRKNKLGDVWKDVFDPKYPWHVQFPYGIMAFHTKNEANINADFIVAHIVEIETNDLARLEAKISEVVGV